MLYNIICCSQILINIVHTTTNSEQIIRNFYRQLRIQPCKIQNVVEQKNVKFKCEFQKQHCVSSIKKKI